MSPEIGYHSAKGTGPIFHGLASEDYQLKSATIDGATRDTGNTNTDDLRQGLTLEKDTTTGKYVEFAGDHTGLVVLAEPLFDLADTGDQIAQVFVRATFYKGSVIETDPVIWSDAQRFIILDQVNSG